MQEESVLSYVFQQFVRMMFEKAQPPHLYFERAMLLLMFSMSCYMGFG